MASCFYILVVIPSFLFISIFGEESDLWMNIKMPTKSNFMGFEPPNDSKRWKEAIDNAVSGKLILLEKVLEQIPYPEEIVSGDTRFGWLQRMSDMMVSQNRHPENELIHHKKNLERAPIVQLGYREFDDGIMMEGPVKSWNPIGAKEIVDEIKSGKFTLPRKFIGIGAMDENWGYLSTHILNRTCLWGMHFGQDLRQHPGISFAEQLSPLLDHPNLVMLVVNQNHNVTHPKVISIPRGMQRHRAKLLWDVSSRAIKDNLTKVDLILSAGSGYRHRPYVLSCIQQNMGKSLSAYNSDKGNLSPNQYYRKTITSRAVLSLPGLGYDCFRIWESLLAGSMPVIERSTGLDRTLYKLPALQVDDFADLTPELIREAYVEALYRVNEWEFFRITEVYWQRLIYEASKTGSHLGMIKKHPMEATDMSFTRPLVPFDCDAIGGCGKGTLRVPKKSCGIDLKADINKYDWLWYENWQEEGKRIEREKEKEKEKKTYNKKKKKGKDKHN